MTYFKKNDYHQSFGCSPSLFSILMGSNFGYIIKPPMKKVLIAFDDAHFSEGAFAAARYLNQTGPIVLVGLFLPSVYYASTPVGVQGVAQPLYAPAVEEDDNDEMESSITRFEEKCKENGIRYLIHGNLDASVHPSIEVETRFADLIILSSEMFYKNLG